MRLYRLQKTINEINKNKNQLKVDFRLNIKIIQVNK